MLRFVIAEIITYYDGVQLAFMTIGRAASAKKFIAAHTIDDGTFLASRISKNQLADLKSGILDVKTIMKNPYNGEYYIVLDPLMLPVNQQNRLRLDQYFSIPVQYDPVFDDWAIPDDGLFLNDLE